MRHWKWLVLQAFLLVINSVIAGRAWRDHEPISASLSIAAVIMSSVSIGNLLSTNLWIGLVDEMLHTGRRHIEMLDRLIKDRNEPRH